MADRRGYLTTEFWLTIAVSGVMAVILMFALGRYAVDRSGSIEMVVIEGLVLIGLSAAMVAPVVVYVWARATIKAAELRTDAG